ncbi:MAG: leucine-rich repeat domain-containing protein [Candidatus Thorarchaeota archaeon]|jgi:hypothetical protein
MSEILNVINYFWKLGFSEEVADLYVKNYQGSYSISIDVVNEIIDYGDRIRVSDDKGVRFSQKNFIVMEAIDRFLRANYYPENIRIARGQLYDFSIERDSGQILMAVRCMEWEEEYDREVSRLRTDYSGVQSIFEESSDTEYFCAYTSRLKAGAIEFRYVVFPRTFNSDDTSTYGRGLFEEGIQAYSSEFIDHLDRSQTSIHRTKTMGDFEVSDGVLMRHTGNGVHIAIPDGVERLRNCLFWNFGSIESIVIPDTVHSLGGDTFYNCESLSELTIPESVMTIGDNPFANCPKLNLINKSPYFVLEDGGLFDKERTRLIYCAINRDSDVFDVPDGVISIGKHSFYNCKNLRRIVIPASVRIIENNPFANLPKLRLENNSPHFLFKEGALYNRPMTTLFYYEHSTESRDLVIPEGVSIIGRHSFYNCQTIETITIPASVKIIGYNPFTGCSHLSLKNHSPEYMYENGTLYDKDKTELIYHSIPNAAEKLVVPDTVEKIGRSALFGCLSLREVMIPEGVTKIERSAFANCANLQQVSIPKSLKRVGEWAFLNCSRLNSIDLPEGTSIGAHTFLGCPAETRMTGTTKVIS